MSRVPPRPAPSALIARTPTGDEVTIELAPRDVVVAVKAHCDGCSSFLNGDLSVLSSRRVIMVARELLDEDTVHGYLVCPEGLDALDVCWAPHYVVLDGDPLCVVGEGPVFSPAQVASELD